MVYLFFLFSSSFRVWGWGWSGWARWSRGYLYILSTRELLLVYCGSLNDTDHMTPAASVAVHWAENVLPPMIFACASCFFARFEAALQFLSGGALRFLGTDVGGREDDRIDAGDRRAQVRWHVLARWIRIGQADGRHHFPV